MAPSPAPHDRPSFPSSSAANQASSKSTSSKNAHDFAAPASTASGAPVTTSPASSRINNYSYSTPSASTRQAGGSSHRTGSRSPRNQQNTGKSPPSSVPRVPSITVKKEPTSPQMPTTRHRPRKLDLSKTAPSGSGAATARPPLTARDGLGIQEVGIACLSPGLVTQDPNMKEQLQRSMTVREQQRAIIEARLLQQSAKDGGPNGIATAKDGGFSAKTPGMSRRNKAPPGLSIMAPAHEGFQNERVIQSAPLGQTFTGLGQGGHPLTRHITNQSGTKLSNTSHIHHVPANQTNNRLPPLSDVFGKVGPSHNDNATPKHATTQPQQHHHQHHQSSQPQSSQQQASHHHSSMYAPPLRSAQPLPSPGHPPASMTHGMPSARTREYKSAEEAQAELAGGRPELLPKIVHYGSHQPPTPPSPQPTAHAAAAPSSASKRRRAEYEEGASPPLGHGPAAQRQGPFGYGRDSPETQRAKKDEFLTLCSRAWDLFHS
ncbi:hypothetical protein HOO65_060471 [Ceratocystis lukuohia]|uniref:Uncharacterized protein n=1 Tax=Ceratocystis lukuohia TaxID=2019550 RepID=A0ABR4MEE8_9PEZI